MKTLKITFNQGIQNPPKLGTLILKPTSESRVAYAQNIDISNDEYGNGTIVPGPALTTIGSNSELTGVPIIKQHHLALNSYSAGVPNDAGYLYFGQGILGTKTVIRRIKNLLSGSTPSIDTTGSMTANHSDHNNQTLVDMLIRPSSNDTSSLYVSGKDDTDTWVYKFAASEDSPSLSLVTVGDFELGDKSQFLVLGSDNLLYWIGQRRVSSIDTADAVTTNKLANGLQLGTYATCAADWNQQLVVGYTTVRFGDFSKRKYAASSGLFIWDYISPSFIKRVPAPCRYISALIVDHAGGLLCFGGVDEGKSTIYEFTGYGFRPLVSYIGDLPRSRHSVEFDALGRILWQTVDGQICRYDDGSGIFEHLGSISTGTSAGGILTKMIGAPTGNEFVAASGSGSTYTMQKIQFGSFLGDGDAAEDSILTPLVISGIQTLPQGSNIQAITLHLTKSLATGENLEVRIYANGSTTSTLYMTMEFGTDGTISSKREVLTLPEINSFSLGIAYKQTNGSATAPPVLYAEVEIGSQYE